MKNWRRYTKYSGPHILEKCCHDLDLINWFCGSLPSKIASFGGRDFFVPENDHYMEKYRRADGTTPFDGWKDPHGETSPFKSEKDIMDNQVAIMEYRNKIRVMFQATMSNAMPERRMYFSGTDGTMMAELYSGELHLQKINDEAVQVFRLVGGGHAGGDEIIMQEFYETISTGKIPKSSGVEGLESSVTAIAIEAAKDNMQVFDLEPVWKKLDR
jgi:predicted dehydrogenase